MLGEEEWWFAQCRDGLFGWCAAPLRPTRFLFPVFPVSSGLDVGFQSCAFPVQHKELPLHNRNSHLSDEWASGMHLCGASPGAEVPR